MKLTDMNPESEDFSITVNQGQRIDPGQPFAIEVYNSSPVAFIVEGVIDFCGDFNGTAVLSTEDGDIEETPIQVTASLSESTELEYYDQEVTYLGIDELKFSTGYAELDEAINKAVEGCLGSAEVGSRAATGYGNGRLPGLR